MLLQDRLSHNKICLCVNSTHFYFNFYTSVQKIWLLRNYLKPKAELSKLTNITQYLQKFLILELNLYLYQKLLIKVNCPYWPMFNLLYVSPFILNQYCLHLTLLYLPFFTLFLKCSPGRGAGRGIFYDVRALYKLSLFNFVKVF